MVNKLCFIKGCRTGSGKQNGPATFFSPPKSNFAKWASIIPKKGLVQKSRLCWKHFREEDIIKGKTILGKFFPHRWKLRDGAVPVYSLGIFLKLKKFIRKLSCKEILFI